MNAGDVRIRVVASGVNRADLLQKRGAYPPPPGVTDVLGLECSGIIEEIGEGVTRWRVGDQVCALLAGGGYGAEVVCAAVQCLPVPRGVSLVEAAALPEVFATAWLNLWEEGALQPGECALVHAGGSGVGTAAIQLCREAGNPVVVTVGSAEKAARCADLGATQAIDRTAGPWNAGLSPVDVILDPVGATTLEADIALLNPGGRLVFIGMMGGRTAPLDLALVLLKRLQIRGSTLRSRSPAEKGRVLVGLERAAWAAIEAGRIRPVIDTVFPIAEVDAAHERLASNATFGKLLLLR